MEYAKTQRKLNECRKEITGLREQMRELQGAVTPQAVEDYEFTGPAGPVRLAELFGAHDALFVVHNMGAACNYCSLWADGFNGLVDQIESRAAFVVSTPDSPDAQQKLAAKCGWRFKMVSHQGNSFAEDMGYTSKHGFEPGVSVFKQDGEQVVRVSDTTFGPGDDFCSIWHLFGLLPEGADDWQPLRWDLQ